MVRSIALPRITVGSLRSAVHGIFSRGSRRSRETVRAAAAGSPLLAAALASAFEGYGLGPAVEPGEAVEYAASLARDEIASTRVVAVVQGPADRIPFVLVASEHGLVLGRMRWTRRIGGRGWTWGITHTRDWDGPETLDEAIADVRRLFGPLDVLR